mmetsp:Transcript_174958/g.561044  ORF Transcript_174958/g.561044 Transcript_174958/m.561044 type:complete len:200 (-) Transcript_174958:354-953(-)
MACAGKTSPSGGGPRSTSSSGTSPQSSMITSTAGLPPHHVFTFFSAKLRSLRSVGSISMMRRTSIPRTTRPMIWLKPSRCSAACSVIMKVQVLVFAPWFPTARSPGLSKDTPGMRRCSSSKYEPQQEYSFGIEACTQKRGKIKSKRLSLYCNLLPPTPKPRSPVHSERKFSQSFGACPAWSSSTTTRPSRRPAGAAAPF